MYARKMTTEPVAATAPDRNVGGGVKNATPDTDVRKPILNHQLPVRKIS